MKNAQRRWSLVLFLSAVLALAAMPAQAQITIYVDANESAPGNGDSWSTAYPALQDAFDRVNENSGTDYEIWVAAGTYYPDNDNVDNDGDGSLEHTADADTSFTLTRDGVDVLGGFDGTEQQRSDRDPSSNVVTLSGDLAEDDDPFEPDTDSDSDNTTPPETDHINGTNATHVLDLDGTGSGTDITSATVIDGLQVRFGRADGSFPASTGGGLLCRGNGNDGVCNPKLRDLTFEGNDAKFGGGMFLYGTNGGQSSPTLESLDFKTNTAVPGDGGAIFAFGEAQPSVTEGKFTGNRGVTSGAIAFQNTASASGNSTLTNVRFEDNLANKKGGALGLFALGGMVRPQLTGCQFTSNRAATQGGGAIEIRATGGGTATPEIDGGSFSQNEAGGPGGAIFVVSDSTDSSGNLSTANPSIVNGTTFSNNTTGANGGALFVQALEGGQATPTLNGADISGDGNATTDEAGRGGGLFVFSDTTNDNGTASVADPVIKNTTFSDLSVGDRGGAVFVGGREGGEARPEFSNVSFSTNQAVAGGGAIEVLGNGTDNNGTPGRAAPTIIGAEFERNNGGNEGGALVNRTKDDGTAEPSITNALFAGNETSGKGGAIVNKSGAPSGAGTASPTLTNVTLTGNTAGGQAGALFTDKRETGGTADPTLTNVILWNNTSSGGEEVVVNGGVPSISYSIVEGGCPNGASCSTNLLDENPQFAGENGGAGSDDTFGTSDDDLRLQGPGSGGGVSPAIDAGNNNAIVETEDIDGNPRTQDGDDDGNADVDMGAYESDSSPLPVELASVDARTTEGAVALTWQTASETGNAGFVVQRRAEDDAWTKVGFVDSKVENGTTSQPQSYRFTDADLPYEADQLTYRLKQVDTDGTTSLSKEVTVERGAVTELQLLGTYPNPVRTEATVRFAVPDAADAPAVTLRLYDVMGREVRSVTADATAGRHERQLDTDGLSSGVYVLRLQAGSTVKTQRLTVVR